MTPKQYRKMFLPNPYIGVFYSPKAKAVRKVVNTQFEWQLYDPSHLKNGNEKLKLFKLPKGNIPNEMGLGDCARIVVEAEKILWHKSS